MSPAQETVESEQTADMDTSKPSEGETEVELVEVVEEMSTEHLQEFACSVSVPKQNKKTKKKKGAQRSAGGEATSVQLNHTDAPLLSKFCFMTSDRPNRWADPTADLGSSTCCGRQAGSQLLALCVILFISETLIRFMHQDSSHFILQIGSKEFQGENRGS